MKRTYRYSFFVGIIHFVFSVLWSPLPAQEVPLSKILLDIPPDTVYFSQDSLLKKAQLPHHFLIPGSDRVYLKTFQLKNHLHYTIDYQKGQIHLLRAYPGVDTVKIVYRKYPFPLINNYFHQKLAAIADDDSLGDNISARAVQPKFLQEIDSYQSRLQKSGSIVRGIEIGSNQDLSLNSGLNLQLSGKITPDVEVVAALTDESTPIQPEGNTQNLREVDKVFVKLKSPYMGGTLGDFNIQYQQSLFGNLQRKLQGITLENQLKQTHQQLTYGTSRGFFHTNRFLGQEGNQGPYQLTGKNGEREIIVLAGTERVYVDGVLQIRGENNDYIIDYSQAQITFTNKKLITSENRIEVDFEYTRSIQRYGRTFVGFSSYTPRAGNRFYYDVRLFREWDDTNNLLEDNAPLTTGERFALQTAGDDPLKAFVSGAQMVEEGSGTYVQDDTLLSDGNIYPYYRYVGPGKGNYLVRFTGVGKQRGDYIRQRLGVFKYVGPGKGEYLPIKLVPLAADKRMANVGVGMKVTNNWNVQGELALSQFDQNVFSAVDDADNEGMAFQFSTSLQDSSFKIAGIRAGKLSFQARWTRQDSSFSPLDRPLQPEYAYKWNFAQQQLTNEENSLESNLMYSPFRALRLMGSFGTLKKGRGVSSTRQMGEIRISRTRFPGIRVRREQVFSQTPLDESNWMRNSLEISHKIWKLHPQYIFRKEDRTVETGMRKTGFLFQESKGIVDIKKLGGVNVQAQVQFREDYLYNPHSFGNTLKQANTSTYELQGEIESARKLSGRFSLAIRKKDYTDFFERLPADSMLIYQPDAQFQDTTWKDRKSNLANLELNYRNESGSITSRLDYQVSSELQALREKVYINVGETRGNFRFDSTLNEYVPDPLGNYILVLLQTGEFESVTNLESAWQFSYRPRLNRDLRGFWKKFLNRISNISYIKIEEQSRLDNVADIYLLNLNKFHKVATSLRSVYTINEDLYYNERNPDWGMLFRSRYRDVLSNLFLDEENNETRIIWERFIQLRKRFFKRRLNVTAEYKNTLNKRWVAAATSRNQNILSQSGLTRWTYRPNYRWQLELSMERGIEKDRFSQNLLQVNYWDIRPEIVYSLRGKARATANLQFLQVQEVSNPLNRPIPFDMGKGKKPGNSWLWNIRFEYFLSNNVIITANYTGRKDAGALKPIHLGKAEVRAFF